MIKLSKNLSLAAVFILIIIIALLSQVFSDDFRIKTLNIFRTPLRIISGLSYALRDIARFQELKTENDILRENIKNMEGALVNLEEERLENIRLRALLDFKESSKRKFVPSLIIARDPFELRDTIIIDKGKRDKVEKDMIVISANGLVGRVSETGWSISRVLLITDYDSVFSGIVQRTRDEGAVVGNGQRGLIMKYLDTGCDVKKGDQVITSGLRGVFEKGILIGEVVTVEHDSGGLYSNAIIKPAVNVMKLEEVLVMR